MRANYTLDSPLQDRFKATSTPICAAGEILSKGFLDDTFKGYSTGVLVSDKKDRDKIFKETFANIIDQVPDVFRDLVSSTMIFNQRKIEYKDYRYDCKIFGTDGHW